MNNLIGTPGPHPDILRVAASRVQAIRRHLEVARADPRTPDSRFGFLHHQLAQARRAAADLEAQDGMTIPAPPALEVAP